MKSQMTYIDAGQIKPSQPKSKSDRKNWKIGAIKKGLKVIQHVSPYWASKIIWNEFTKPGKARFSDAQLDFVKQATRSTFTYRSQEIHTYRWGTSGPKVLLVHGWRSKMADFRKMIEAFVAQGYVVEGMDMKAHGYSSGERTALPEFRDLVLHQFDTSGPYHAVVGYSLGGIAAGVAMAERENALPAKLFIISAPPFVRYFFKEAVVAQAGCGERVYERMCDLVQENYQESIDHFDLRQKLALENLELHLIYDEDDQVVSIDRGRELLEKYPAANWVQTRGVGHYKIIAFSEVIHYMAANLAVEKREMVG